ncbi:MAG: hypothetical protein ACFCU6_10985, partial [Balneolaceae bacterium]
LTETSNVSVKVYVKQQINLLENLEPLSRIERAGFFNGVLFGISSREDGLLYLYKEAEQIAKIGKNGKGPYEYRKPGPIKMYGDILYVWDYENRKFVGFNKELEPVEEFGGIVRQVSDFCMTKKFIAIFHNDGTVRIYDKNDKSLIYENNDANIDDRVLLILDSNGRIACNEDNVIFGYPSRSELYHYKVSTSEILIKKIDDEDFHVNPTGWNSIQEVNQNIQKVNEYLFTNSALIGFYGLDRYIVGVADIGKFDPADLAPSFNLNYSFSEKEKRRKHFYVFDKDLNYLEKIVLTPDVNDSIGNQILGAYGNSLYFLKQNIINKNLSRTISELAFESTTVKNN